MRIKEKKSQHRRDFYADMECEHCGHIEKGVSCYDDAFFHNNVIPNMECKSCGKKSPKEYKPLATKYPEGFQV
jgi:transcription elongation factor Elf1